MSQTKPPARAPTVPASAALVPPSALTRISKAILRAYFKLYHRYEVVGVEHIPARPPVLVLTNHVSLLDVPAFGLIDPFSGSVLVGKASLMRVPIVGQVLRAWGVIPVERSGQDSAALREVLRSLKEGRLVAIAAEGTRNRAGRLGEVNPVLAKLAMTAGVPLLPIVAVGTYRALPPGAWFPRPARVCVNIGPLFDLSHLRGRPKAEAVEAARVEIRRRLLALLPSGERDG